MKPKETVAIVDDEQDIIELISLHLLKHNYKVESFQNAESFFQYIKKNTVDLLLLDLMLPDMDGLEICKYMRTNETLKHIPIIMITAKQDETDKIVGFELGADDYITKPFSPREVMARVKAVLRRSVNTEDVKEIVNIDNLIYIDKKKYEVYDSDNNKIVLTSTEFNILKILAGKRGWVFPREQLLDILWGDEKVVIDRTIDVHIRHLRKKLGPAGSLIKNVRGVGYKLES